MVCVPFLAWSVKGYGASKRVPSQNVLEPQIPWIVYADPLMAVVAKPSGELVHPGWARGEATTMSRLRDALGQRVHPVHRLDRATSGLVVMARSPRAAAILSELWQTGQVEKRYLALVRGVPPDRLAIDHPVRKGEAGDERVEAFTEIVRLAVSPADRCSLVEAIPMSGRLHQIRRHLKHVSHPIIGDVGYGDGRINRHFRAGWQIHRLCLHAFRLKFPHPDTGEPLALEAPLPPDLATPLGALGVWPQRLSATCCPTSG